MDRAYVGRILNLTLLAPDVVEAVLDGRQAVDLINITRGGSIPAHWVKRLRAYPDLQRLLSPKHPGPRQHDRGTLSLGQLSTGDRVSFTTAATMSIGLRNWAHGV